MAISLKTNLTSLMARRNLSEANSQLKSNIEKLSTGFRINSASDDAAGLAVSEGMKADIRSIGQAERNAQDAVSMLQTAEGGMGQIHDILGRMKELSVQANSDSISDDARDDIDEEYQQLASEINDIAEGTNFNDVELLNGSFTGKSLQVGPAASDTLSLAISQNFDSAFIGKEISAGDANVKSVTNNGTRVSFAMDAGIASQFATGQEFTVEDASGDVLTSVTVESINTGDHTVSFGGNLSAANVSAQQLDFVGGIGDADVTKKSNASFAAAAINDAISRLSTERGKLGAQVNRLDVKLTNLSNTKQNLEAANSRIRDVNVAKEMANLTKNQILTQAGTSMLQQANQMPQTALSLLGGG